MGLLLGMHDFGPLNSYINHFHYQSFKQKQGHSGYVDSGWVSSPPTASEVLVLGGRRRVLPGFNDSFFVFGWTNGFICLSQNLGHL